jgi:hypothetical protein
MSSHSLSLQETFARVDKKWLRTLDLIEARMSRDNNFKVESGKRHTAGHPRTPRTAAPENNIYYDEWRPAPATHMPTDSSNNHYYQRSTHPHTCPHTPQTPHNLPTQQETATTCTTAASTAVTAHVQRRYSAEHPLISSF